MSYFLGVDQSLNAAGFALVDADGRYVDSRTVKVGDLTGAARLWRVEKTLQEFTHLVAVRAAAREGFSVKSSNRPFDLGMVAGVLDLEVYRHYSIEPILVPPLSLKKFVTGVGAATSDKTKMLYTVKKRWGVDLGDRDDEADAFGLAMFARAVTLRTFATRAEAEAVAALEKPKRPRLRARRSITI